VPVEDSQKRDVMVDSGIQRYDMRNDSTELVHLTLRLRIGIWSHVQCGTEVNSVVVPFVPLSL
jgi:hypothetical protein